MWTRIAKTLTSTRQTAARPIPESGDSTRTLADIAQNEPTPNPPPPNARRPPTPDLAKLYPTPGSYRDDWLTISRIPTVLDLNDIPATPSTDKQAPEGSLPPGLQGFITDLEYDNAVASCYDMYGSQVFTDPSLVISHLESGQRTPILTPDLSSRDLAGFSPMSLTTPPPTSEPTGGVPISRPTSDSSTSSRGGLYVDVEDEYPPASGFADYVSIVSVLVEVLDHVSIIKDACEMLHVKAKKFAHLEYGRPLELEELHCREYKQANSGQAMCEAIKENFVGLSTKLLELDRQTRSDKMVAGKEGIRPSHLLSRLQELQEELDFRTIAHRINRSDYVKPSKCAPPPPSDFYRVSHLRARSLRTASAKENIEQLNALLGQAEIVLDDYLTGLYYHLVVLIQYIANLTVGGFEILPDKFKLVHLVPNHQSLPSDGFHLKCHVDMFGWTACGAQIASNWTTLLSGLAKDIDDTFAQLSEGDKIISRILDDERGQIAGAADVWQTTRFRNEVLERLKIYTLPDY